MNEHILFSYELNGTGGAKHISGEMVSDSYYDNNLCWFHLDANATDTENFLTNICNIDDISVKALLADETRPRLVKCENGILIILRGMNFNNDSDPEDMISIRLWITENNIITIRKRKLKAVLDIEDKLNKGKGPANTGDFICILINRLFERMEPVLSDLNDVIDDIEEKIMESASSIYRDEIVNTRKKAILFKRYMSPQKDVISQLRLADVSFLDDLQVRKLQESYNHVTRYIEDLDSVRERSQIIKDELSNILADKLNKNMYVLSVISAIFLPLGFLTGLVGVNLGGIPGSDNKAAFLVFCSILALIVFLQIAIFKKLKWF